MDKGITNTASSYQKLVWNVYQHLTLDDDFIVYDCRLLISFSMCNQVLHEGHQGALQTKNGVRLTIYWPGLDNNIDNVMLAC